MILKRVDINAISLSENQSRIATPHTHVPETNEPWRIDMYKYGIVI